MGRKFSLDLRLKLSQLKTDSKPSENVEESLESPPLAYTSLGPPLSTKVETELRAACAYVAQDYKPSEQIYDELLRDQPDSKPRENGHVDYVAGVVQEAPGVVASNATNKTQRKDRAPRSRSLMNAVEEMQMNYRNDSHSNYRSAEVEQQPQLQQQRQQTIMGVQRSVTETVSIHQHQPLSPASTTTTVQNGTRPPHSRSRSIPLPVHYPPSMSKNEDNDHLKTTTGRISSMDTADFTPRTDLSEYPWSGSTAPTSAALASLQSSKRTSSQALQLGFENGRVPMADAEWMQRELEKHKKLQEARAQQEAQEALVASVWAETTSQARGGVGEISIERGEANDAQQNGTEASVRPSGGSRQRSFTQEVRHYFRPDPADLEDSDTRPQSSSRRSGSFSRHLQDFVRPRSSQLRRESYDRVNRSRAESIESNQTAATSTSVNSNSSRWRSWRPWPGNRRAESPDPARSESPGLGFRGRAPTREHFWSSSKRPAIDLNRELPPLPSLDQWKDDDADEVQSPNSTAASPIEPQPNHNHQYQSAAARASKYNPTRSISLAVPLSSTTNSHNQQPRRTPLNSPEIDSHALMASDFDDPASAAILHSDRSHAGNGGNGGAGGRRHRSRSIQAEYPPDIAERIRIGDFGPSYSSTGTLGLAMPSPTTTRGGGVSSPQSPQTVGSPISPMMATSGNNNGGGGGGNRAPATSVSSHMPARSGSWQAFFERPGSAFSGGGRKSVDILRASPASAAGPFNAPPLISSQQQQQQQQQYQRNAGSAAAASPVVGGQPAAVNSSSKKRWWKAIKSSKKEAGWMDRGIGGSRPDSKAGVMVVESGNGGSPVVMF